MALMTGSVLVATLGPSAANETPTPGYLTLQFGRMQWLTANNCTALQGSVPLQQVADTLASRRLKPTGTVVVNRTDETVRRCYRGYTLSASWSDLARLRDDYSWTFVSNGTTHDDITKMTLAQQYEESCGSLPPFNAHGHHRAWGLFAYGNNKSTAEIQDETVSKCFAYGRTYKQGVRNIRSEMAPPWFQKTHSLAGGRCNDPALPCYNMTVGGNTRYMSPVRLATLVNVPQDAWFVLQGYRFMTGARTEGTTFRWDCTSPDWRKHWTSNVEMYCLQDYLYVIDRIPSGVVVTDPASVAEAWGRVEP